MIKKTGIIIAFLLICWKMVPAQDYKTGIGLRGGWISGLTVKHFIQEGKALELLLSNGYRYRGWQITGLFEIHKPAFAKDDVEGLFWLYGLGAHFGGGARWEHYHPGNGNGNWGYYHVHQYVSVGIDFIFGMEYKIKDIPFTVGVDVKPFFEFVRDYDAPFGFWDSALSIRYVF